MKKIKDAIRFVVVSPEVLSALLVMLIAYKWPEVINFFVKFVTVTDTSSMAIIVGVPLAMLIGGYKLGFDVLNPPEYKRALKLWPGYWMMKNRIIFSWLLGTMGLLGTIVAYFLANNGSKFLGTLLIAISWVVAASSVACIAYAKMTLNDVLNEKD